ncbi:MAG: hypothetical protein QOJ88_1020 [Pyrinomonadaceae bacterium]|nr:hypothetical protein [Pyrinomonadaceae bacterium]
MALDSIKLDDLSWNEMVVAIRRRIAAASDGNWTLHAPVDPGITLLELFAYLLDQRVYWMDQVPDSLVRGALSLLGEQPRSTRAAATVVHFPELKKTVVLNAGTELTLARSVPALVFSTAAEIALLPFESGRRLSLFIDNVDRTADLEHGKVMRLFPPAGSGEVRIVLRLREPLPESAKDKCCSLLFQLRTPSGVAPEWVPQWSALGTVTPPAKISWFYGGGGGKRIEFSANEINDGTGGLRRSGLVLLPLKTGTGTETDWSPEYDAKTMLYSYSLWLRVEQSTFSAPPRLERLVPNVVIASHQRTTAEHKLHRDFLPLPGNTLDLADLPEDKLLKDHPPIEDTIKLQIREADGQWHPWRPVLDFSFHGPSDRVFTTDRLLGQVSFGDGLTGRLPVLNNDGDVQLKVEYSVGGGVSGNLGAHLDWKISSAKDEALANLTGVNLVQTEGGAEPETMAAARQRAGLELRKRTRAVVREDYEELARTIPGVAIKRAYAAVGLHPNFPCVAIPGAVTVFLVPDVSRPDVLSEESLEYDGSSVESAFVAAPVPDPGALAMVRAKLEKARLAGSEVFVSAPHYQAVDLFLDVESNSLDADELSRQIRRRLRYFLDPLSGGDAGLGWPFGEPLRPSAILREVQAALGDEGRVERLFIVLPDKSPKRAEVDYGPCVSTPVCSASETAGETQVEMHPSQPDEPACADVLIGEYDLVELRRLSLNFSRGTESQGGLR